jgi:sporulation related protein
MRFRYIDFTEILTERERGETGKTREKAVSRRIGMALVALFVCFCPLTASAQARKINGYALQVAAMSSRRSADALAQGLSARGMKAYWVGGASYSANGPSALYRVRIGNFRTIASASNYAENLLGAGLLDAYAITAYESPSKDDSLSISNWKIQTFAQKRPQKYPGRQSGARGVDVIDVIATIGSRGWLLLSSDSINLTVRNDNSALGRELATLIDAISSRGWALNSGAITKFLGASAPVTIVSLPSEVISSRPIASASTPANSGSLNAASPEIGRRGGTTASLSSRSNNPPPRLQGSIEMREGRMYMTLRNTDTDRVFSGVARISLSDDKKQQDVTPITVTVLPDREAMIPVDDAALTNGDWILMVYDQNGAARLIRGASLTRPKKPTQSPNSTGGIDSTELATAPDAPPSYVTGVYDTTSWAQPEVPPQAENGEQQTAVPSAPIAPAASSGQDDTRVVEGAADSTTPNAQAANDPGVVTATLRQIAATNENVTLELDISGQNALKNITVTLRAGDFQDVRQAFIPTSQGRVPFLVPARFASEGIFYEIKDEAQRLLHSGNSNLRSLSK